MSTTLIKDLVVKNRSYRRFDETAALDRSVLEGLVDLGRLAMSAANRQPLKYLIFCDPERNARIFDCLGWAGYLKDWPGPEPGERPTGYIVMLMDTQIKDPMGLDAGLAAANILLGAVERGLGGCLIGNIKRDELRALLGIEDRYQLLAVIALGKPVERVVLEKAGPGPEADIKYWRDERQVHHVPKRELREIILN
ncbi:nitroreductase [Hydrogenispora ethanolica]|uniref:Nitroreductase n=1 Tax=Hydrogenispora ethanolica TaxID=1082276 RepID=A0A4R1S2X7_HYDET|nr:nitroreductase family protein [Hydrogenispora ethanolica]TCL73264.1 nitroreductase [Hydrogenispora ethanolica]